MATSSYGQKENQLRKAASAGFEQGQGAKRAPISRESSILRLQQTAGNQAIQRLIHAKLAVNTPGDETELEAEHVADEIMSMSVQGVAGNAPPQIQRSAGETTGRLEPAPPSVDQALGSPGAPLDSSVREDMEQRFGHDFSQVRVHTGAEAEQSAEDVNANAYTLGHDVVFAAGRFAPGTQEGRGLIAHELTHVVQQEATSSGSEIASPVTGPEGPDRRTASSRVHSVLHRDRRRGGATAKAATGVTWEDALVTMNAITQILPRVEEHGIVLPTFGPLEPTLSAAELAQIPERYRDLVREWHYIVHPLHTTASGAEISIYGTMREAHLNQAVAETQPLVNELATEGEASSTVPFLAAYWQSVDSLREDVAQEVVAEAAEKAKTVEGSGFAQLSEIEKAKTLVNQALEAVHLATKVVNQFSQEAIHQTVHEAEHLAKMKKLDELFREAARQAGEVPHGGVLEAASKLSLAAALVHLEGGLHGLSAILAVSDPHKREEMFRARSDLFGQASVVVQGSKLALQFAAGATALSGAGAYAVAKLLGKEGLASEVLAKGVPILEKLDFAISGVLVVHGVLTLLDSEATGEEKEEAVLEVGIGGATVLGRLIGGLEGGPASLSVVISFFTLKALAAAAVGFSVDLVKISLTQCYLYMSDEARSVNDGALRLAIALQLSTHEPDPGRRAYFKRAADLNRGSLVRKLADALRHATDEKGARDRDPASHEPLRKRFLPLLSRPTRSDVELLEMAEQYVHIVAEALAHQQEILDEEVEYVWEHYG